MDRILVFDRLDQPLGDLDPSKVIAASYVEAINGEHSVTIETKQELEKTNRLLMQDGMGNWREYVVLGIEETRDSKVYYCIWSLQYDLSATFVNNQYGAGVVPGHASVPVSPSAAMDIALEGTERWARGTVTATTMAAASFYRRSGWEALKTLVENWGGELDATITVGPKGVTGRAVDLLEHVGATDATRRFDFGWDVKSIKRVVSDDIWPCRIIPLGKAQETENGGYTRRPDISSVNDSVMWLQDDDVVAETRVKKPGGWEYPTVIVENDTYEEPTDLKAWALANITDYTRPKVTYEADVIQFGRAGLDPKGVALGDNVSVSDRTFKAGGLHILARVTKIKGSLIDPSDITLTIGNAAESITSRFSNISRMVDELAENVERTQQWQATDSYLSHLLERINASANATGGYTYITQGYGLRTYDVPVSDPLVGSEASQVVEIKGGTIRIANSKDQAGNWNWKTVFTADHIAGDMVTAASIITGFIGSAGGTFIDLDNNTIQLGDSNKFHCVISNNTFEFYNGSTKLLHFGEKGWAGGTVVNNALTASIGEQLEDIPGNGSFTAGEANHATRYAALCFALGRGLYAPGFGDAGRKGGLALGQYNTYGTLSGIKYANATLLNSIDGNTAARMLMLGIGAGSDDANRANILEVDEDGNFAVAGNAYCSNVGTIIDSGDQTVTTSTAGEAAIASIVIPSQPSRSSGQIWVLFGKVDIGSVSTQDTRPNVVGFSVNSDPRYSLFHYEDTPSRNVSFSTLLTVSRSSSDSTYYLHIRIGANNPSQSRSVKGRIRAVRIT